MNNDTRVTPVNRLREYLVRLANDKDWGQRLGYWIGKVAGGIQYQLVIKSSDAIPWTPLKRSLAEATVAIVATGGVHCCADKPFVLSSDASFRAIPRTTTNSDLCITHEHYDRRDAARDLNLIFPLERLLELETEGIIGRVANVHYGFGFTHNPQQLLLPGRKVGTLLAEAHVDLVILVPA